MWDGEADDIKAVVESKVLLPAEHTEIYVCIDEELHGNEERKANLLEHVKRFYTAIPNLSVETIASPCNWMKIYDQFMERNRNGALDKYALDCLDYARALVHENIDKTLKSMTNPHRDDEHKWIEKDVKAWDALDKQTHIPPHPVTDVLVLNFRERFQVMSTRLRGATVKAKSSRATAELPPSERLPPPKASQDFMQSLIDQAKKLALADTGVQHDDGGADAYKKLVESVGGMEDGRFAITGDATKMEVWFKYKYKEETIVYSRQARGYTKLELVPEKEQGVIHI